MVEKICRWIVKRAVDEGFAGFRRELDDFRHDLDILEESQEGEAAQKEAAIKDLDNAQVMALAGRMKVLEASPTGRLGYLSDLTWRYHLAHRKVSNG
jgi:hypothetical protein